MKRYKPLFESSEGNTYKSLLIDYMIFLHSSWIKRYSDDNEVKSCTYMSDEIDRWIPEW